MKNKKLIMFDLDGTLTQSKSPLSHGEAVFLWELLGYRKVGVISGASWSQFENQFLQHFYAANPPNASLYNLHLMPTCGSALYQYQYRESEDIDNRNHWHPVYKDKLSEEEKVVIMDAFRNSIPRLSYGLGKSYGPRIEDRDCQITFSALGQNAPLEEKANWDEATFKRQELKLLLREYLHDDFEIRIGGATSVDVTRKGIDKAYGVARIAKHLGLSYDEILFVGDALYAGGNDYPVKAMGVECISVNGPQETIGIIIQLLGGE